MTDIIEYCFEHGAIRHLSYDLCIAAWEAASDNRSNWSACDIALATAPQRIDGDRVSIGG